MTAHDRASIAHAQIENAPPTSPVRVTIHGAEGIETSPMHTEDSIRKRLDEKRNLKCRRLYLTDGDGDIADAFGGRERTVDTDVNLVHKLSINTEPMRVKERTAPLFVTLEARAGQLVGSSWAALIHNIDAAGDDEDARQRKSKELCGALIGCVSATLTSADKSRHSSYNFQMTSARGGVLRVSGDDDIVRFIVCMLGNNLPKQTELGRIQSRPDSDFPEGHATVFKLAKWLIGGAQGLTVQTINKDPKKVCERACVRAAHTLA